MNGKRPKSTICDNTTQTIARIEVLTRDQAIDVLKKLSTYPIVQSEVLKMPRIHKITTTNRPEGTRGGDVYANAN